jgi:hypothetical protein
VTNQPIHDDGDLIKTWRCPLCGGRAMFESLTLVPWFCMDDRCDVLGWDPYSTLEENLMDAAPVQVIHNQGNSGEMHKP